MARLRRLPRPFLFWALAGLALLGSHDLVYLVQVGPGEDVARLLRQAGHGYWGSASLVVAAISAVSAGAMALRLVSLRRTARSLGAPALPGTQPFRSRWTGAWVRLSAVVLLAFVLQENVEHWLTHGHLLGLGAVVGPEYPLAIPLIGAMGALAAAAIALIGRVEGELLVRIASALARALQRRPLRHHRPDLGLARPGLSPLAGAAAGRAPPSVLALAR
jgi:hypothetical protein